MKEYAVIIEQGPASFGAYVPDLPGCVAVAETEGEVKTLIREAIQLHIEALREDGEPDPRTGVARGIRPNPSRILRGDGDTQEDRLDSCRGESATSADRIAVDGCTGAAS